MLKDIGKRCSGDIYLGVVGPVRCGKSTFIKRFMELAVIPYMEDVDAKKRAQDELPQSGEGRMIMTVEPKFVPNNAANIFVDDDFSVSVRLVDCVGYVIEGAKGYEDDYGTRYVKTPWFNEAIPFDEAAKVGTKKVIQDHSTIGIVVTSDGSVTDIEKENYVGATEEIIEELTQIGKPFVIVVNSRQPSGIECQETVRYYQERYPTPVIPLKVNEMSETDITSLLKEALYEFPVSEVKIEVPQWIAMMDNDHWLKKQLDDALENALASIYRLKDVETIGQSLNEVDFIDHASISDIDTSMGSATLSVFERKGLYHDILKEIIQIDDMSQGEFLNYMRELVKVKNEFDRLGNAIAQVEQTGYGYALPQLEDIELTDPVLVKQGSRYGMKMIAKASTIHMIKVDVESTFEPIIGSKEQSEAFISYLMSHDAKDREYIYNCDVFGRKLGDIIQEGIRVKLMAVPETASHRIYEILYKIVNKGKSNVIAIVL